MPAMIRLPPSSRSRAIDTLRRPVSGSLATITPAVMYGAASRSNQVGTGKSAGKSTPRSTTTSWTGAASMSTGGSGRVRASRQRSSRSFSVTPSASAKRARELRILPITGMAPSPTFSKSRAGPRSRKDNTAPSSNRGSTRRVTRCNCPLASRAAIMPRRLWSAIRLLRSLAFPSRARAAPHCPDG